RSLFMHRLAQLVAAVRYRQRISNPTWQSRLMPLFGLAALTLAVGSTHGQSAGKGRMNGPQMGRIGGSNNPISSMGYPQTGGIGMMNNRAIPSLPMGSMNFNGYPGVGTFGMAYPFAANLANSNAAALANLYGSGALSSGPYGGNMYSNGYGTGYGPYMDPNYAYLKGGAEVAIAQGNLMVNQQWADLLKQKVRAEQLATREAAYQRAQSRGHRAKEEAADR